MIDVASLEILDLECRIFTKYLAGEDPAGDVLQAYQRAHTVSTVAPDAPPPGPVDRALLRIARVGPRCTRGADGYAAVFAKATLLRRKLVLLVAILESRGDTASKIDSAEPGPRWMWMLQIGAQALGSVVVLSLAALLIIPLSLWYRLVDAPAA